MPNIIDNTYFKHDLFIPHAVQQATVIPNNTPTSVSGVEDCITYTEKSILMNALGVTLYDALMAELPVDGNSDQKWKDLINGVTYDGKVWEGLGSAKSLLAYAVYFNYLNNNSSFWSDAGIIKPESENATNITPDYKLATAWQKFLKKYQGDHCGEPYRAIIDGATFTDYYGYTGKDVYVSLLQYLRDKKEVYGWDDENFKFYRQKNSFGL